uniref:DUF2523 domain-containing protein n=1 Tax=viral metagenome TaxID=1070528 RepID=A0A6H1Z7B4_9ZZZZ
MPWIPVVLAWLGSELVFRVLVSLGMGLLTFGIYTTAVDTLKTQVETAYAGLPANMMAFAEIVGLGEFVAIVLTALVTRAAYDFMPRFGRKPA